MALVAAIILGLELIGWLLVTGSEVEYHSPADAIRLRNYGFEFLKLLGPAKYWSVFGFLSVFVVQRLKEVKNLL